MSWFDAICHAFGTMATGGFSTYNKSVGHFNSEIVEYTITLFMILAGTNFTLLYLAAVGRPGRLLADVEWRTYLGGMFGATAAIIAVAMIWHDDFDPQGDLTIWEEWRVAMRYGLFQVVSVMTTTGFGTHDFDRWNQFGRAVLFLLMYVGGCAGSTAGGLKVIRHILFLKTLRLEIERSFHPNVVRHLRLGGEPITDPPDLEQQILLYFGLITFIFMCSWILLVGIESDDVWTGRNMPVTNKLIDGASAVVATLNNIGPGLGSVGSTQNYAEFNWMSKLLFTFLMMLGRLELFAILVLLVPGFWRTR
jgi:trk system potassium uptake protein TrkH